MIVDTQNITFKNMLPWGLLIVAIVVVLLIVYRKVPIPGKDPIYEYLQKQSDSLLKVDRILTADSVRQKVIDSLTQTVQTKEQKIKIIKQNVQKTIHVYDNYSPRELERILTERYNGVRTP